MLSVSDVDFLMWLDHARTVADVPALETAATELEREQNRALYRDQRNAQRAADRLRRVREVINEVNGRN